MKKLNFLLLFILFAFTAGAQYATLTVTTPPCHADGVVTANVTGLTPPLTYTWYVNSTTTVHSGITSTSDTYTGFPGGSIFCEITDGVSYAYADDSAAGLPFTYYVSTVAAPCPGVGSATVTVSGGVTPYTYNWYNKATLATVGTTATVSLPAGEYGIMITDAAGCTFGSVYSGDSIVIESIPAFSVTTTNTPANCTNGTASITAISPGAVMPVSYAWSTGATTTSISGLITGVYSVTVTDALGCAATSAQFVPQAIAITVPVTPTPATCIASDGSAIAFGSGGMPPYAYAWSNGSTTQSITGLTAGYYSVNVTDANGCIGSGAGYVGASTPISATYTATPSSCTAPTGSVTLTVTGGTTPYTIAWYTSPPQTGLSATGLSAGDYGFKITDAVGCVQTGAAVVNPVDIISVSYTSTAAQCLLADGALSVTPSGGALPYTYSWSTGATTSSITGIPYGGYTVTITDNNSCSVTKYLGVPYSSPLSVGIASTDASCKYTADGSITAVPYGGTYPYAYTWSTGATTPTASALGAGYYNVTVTDASGCVGSNYTSLGYDASNTSCYCTISGVVYNDTNNNCVRDTGEVGIPDIQMYVSGFGYAYTDAAGYYSFEVPTGSYTLSETILGYYPLSACQLNNVSVVSSAATGCTLNYDFANTVNPIHDMHISTWDYSWPVPGNVYDQVSVVSNEGTVSETGILAGYNTDGQLASPTFTPAGIFSGTGDWYSTPATFPTLAPGSSQEMHMDYNVPTDIPLATSVVFKDTASYIAPISNWLNDYSPWNNVDYFTATVVGSYDPNFKEVSPKGTGPEGIITYNDSVLEYMVHFQNTGTAPAENIVVIDTLDANLNWASLRPVYESHNCVVTMDTHGVVKFTFSDINLPTKASNEVTSNGMFTYTVKTKTGMPLGTQFKNNASIYFDYNAPVVTNTTVNTLGAPTAVNNVQAEATTFSVYPNPAGSNFKAVITSDVVNANAEMRVCDITGKVMIYKQIAIAQGTQTVSVDAAQLSAGVYFISLNEGNKVQTQKLVIIK